jgi:hypothetical protein
MWVLGVAIIEIIVASAKIQKSNVPNACFSVLFFGEVSRLEAFLWGWASNSIPMDWGVSRQVAQIMGTNNSRTMAPKTFQASG